MAQVNVDAGVAPKQTVKPEVKVDQKLAKLFDNEQKAGKTAALATVAIIDYLKEHKQCTNDVIQATLMQARGVSKESARTLASNYTKYLLEENADKVELLREGKITVQVMRQIKTGSAAGRPRATAEEKWLKGMESVANFYVNDLVPLPEGKFTRMLFLEEACETVRLRSANCTTIRKALAKR